MRLKFSPCGGSGASTAIEVIDENTIKIDDETFEVPLDLVELNPVGPILAGYRDDDGVLSLTIVARYCDADKGAWEMPPYRGSDFEDHGPGVVL